MRPIRVRGFTLVEVLVALLVLAMMAAMAWQGVDGIVRARTASQSQLEQTLRLNTVIGQWEADLAAVQETGSVPALNFDGSTLRMTRRTPSGVQLVAWSLRPDPNGSPWRRWAGPVVTGSAALQDSWIQSQQLLGNERGQLDALTGLTGWQVYFYFGNAWSNAQSSANVVAGAAAGPIAGPTSGAAPAPPIQQALPSGVRVVLSFAPGSGLNGTLTRDTLLNP